MRCRASISCGNNALAEASTGLPVGLLPAPAAVEAGAGAVVLDWGGVLANRGFPQFARLAVLERDLHWGSRDCCRDSRCWQNMQTEGLRSLNPLLSIFELPVARCFATLEKLGNRS